MFESLPTSHTVQLNCNFPDTSSLELVFLLLLVLNKEQPSHSRLL
jgi:hypothetical protein